VHSSWGFLGYLEALRQEGVAKFLAQPRLVTKSGRPASFLVGGEQAVPVPAGLGQIGVQFEEFGTRLNFLPIVLGNGKIHLEVEPEISALNAANGVQISGTVVPGRDTQRINTTVELETGQTFVIGGLIQHVVQSSTRKTPVLGDLPFLGAFFSVKIDNETEQEVVILVTPYLVDGQSCDQVAKVLPGQETRTPDDFELFLEGILEAPRGPRQLCQDGRYIPAFKNSATTELFPCAGKGTCGTGCGGSGAAPLVPPGIGLAPAANPTPLSAAPDSALTAGPKAADPVQSTAPKAAETAPVAEQPSADAVQPASTPTPVLPPGPPAEGDKP
jgi:pilus assembly protein CpaC